ALEKHIGEALAEVASRAAADHLQYVEVMHTADRMKAAILGDRIGWDIGSDDDFGTLRDKLLAGGMRDIVTSVRGQLDSDEAREKEVLRCGTAQAVAGLASGAGFRADSAWLRVTEGGSTLRWLQPGDARRLLRADARFWSAHADD